MKKFKKSVDKSKETFLKWFKFFLDNPSHLYLDKLIVNVTSIHRGELEDCFFELAERYMELKNKNLLDK